MSKTITIPTRVNPYTVQINGVKYSYVAGSTATVPDEVAAEIERSEASFLREVTPDYPEEGTVLTAGENGKREFKALDAATTEKAGAVKQAENIEDSTAESVADLKSDFNDLLDGLKAAGVMEADEESE